MSHMMKHGLGDCPPGCYQPDDTEWVRDPIAHAEPPADITPPVTDDGAEPVLDDPPLAIRVALKTTAYVTVIALLACVAVAALGLLIRIFAWALGFSS